MDMNFSPAVKCPYCGKTNHPIISGWGGQLNTRTKLCRHCQKEYTLLIFAEAVVDSDISGEISSLRSRIDISKSKINELKHNLEDKYAMFAREYLYQEMVSHGRQN